MLPPASFSMLRPTCMQYANTIQNFSNNSELWVDLKCQLPANADHLAAMQLLREKIAKVENVFDEPEVEVEILEFNPHGLVLAVRPYCDIENYSQVHFDSNKVILAVLKELGCYMPMPG